MMQEPTATQVEAEAESGRRVVHMLMQFALAVRYRKGVVILALVVSFLLCGLYYATATRLYRAVAGLVLQINADTWSPGMAMQESWEQSMLPTYQGLITRSEVIKGAIERIPREHRIDFAHEPREKWVEIVQSKLSVTNVRRTNIVEVGFNSKDPNTAVTVVNAIVDSYQEFMDSRYKSTASEILVKLNKERADVEAELAEKEAQLAGAREQTRNLKIDSNTNVLHPLIQQVSTLSNQLEQRQLQRNELEAQLAAVRRAVSSGEDLGQYVFALADVVDPEVLRQRLGLGTQDVQYRNELLRTRMADEAKLSELRKHLGWAHPDIVALEARIAAADRVLLGVEDQMRQDVNRVNDARLGPMLIEVVEQKLNAAREIEARLQQAFNQAYDRAVKLTGQLALLDRLEEECQRLKEDRSLLMKQISEVKLESQGEEVRVHIVDWPEVDKSPVSPRLAKTILIALVSGLGVGLMLVYVLDILDDRFRSTEELQAMLGVPVLAMIRELESSEEAGVAALQAYRAPNASESEAFRTLRTTLSLADQDTHQVVITSPEPGDGKTTVLANLAVTVAQSGKKTLLIDADLRRPGLTAMLGMRGIEGLSTVIRGEGELVAMARAHIRPSGQEGLDVLPSGPRPTNPAELLGSQRFSELLAWAESVYDQVFIDSPPMLATSDTAVIGRLTNGVVLVVQPAKNRRRAVMRCGESFAVTKTPLLGVVLNRVGAAGDGYYGYGYGGYYGYDYAYRYAGDEDEESDAGTDLEAALAASADVTRMPGTGRRGGDEETPAGGIVPRRVA